MQRQCFVPIGNTQQQFIFLKVAQLWKDSNLKSALQDARYPTTWATLSTSHGLCRYGLLHPSVEVQLRQWTFTEQEKTS